MIDQLEQLSLALSPVDKDQARVVANAVTNKVLDLVNGQVGKLYWSSEAESGILLTPLGFVNRTQKPDPRPFQMNADHVGILSWVLRHREALWLEKLRTTGLQTPVTNKVTSEPVAPEYLDMAPNPWCDSMMIIPLIRNGDVRGLYSIELASSGVLTDSILALLRRIARPLAAIFWGTDVYVDNEERTSNAVSQFVNVFASYSFDEVLLSTHRGPSLLGRSSLSFRTWRTGSFPYWGPRASATLRISQMRVVATSLMIFNAKSGTPTSVSQT
jgi:hypothetical protein